MRTITPQRRDVIDRLLRTFAREERERDAPTVPSEDPSPFVATTARSPLGVAQAL